jgi:nitrite reductase/ring-hydroxylating ferredoxin subunit
MSSAQMFTATAGLNPAPPSEWIKALALSEIAPGDRRILRAAGKQILLVRTETGVHACNNRCPHEGYPLVEGSVSTGNAGGKEGGKGDCVLTCNWHNWKFDLISGETLVGGDVLRRYPVEIRDGTIWLDVADPPAEQQITAALGNLKDSFEDHEYDRMAREISRLAKAGGDPIDAVRHAIRWTHQRFEFGTTHALAAAPDWLALRARLAGDDGTLDLVPLVEIVGHLCWDSLRWREFPFPEGTRTFDSDALVQAIENEDEAATMALVRGAFADGGRTQALDGPITRAAAAHYQDFGHAMIYAYKTRQLADALGPDLAEAIYLTLARSLVYASREDLIPEFRAYGATRAAWDGTGDGAVDAEDFRHLGVKPALAKALSASGNQTALFDALVSSAAWQMLHFDMHYMTQDDRPVPDNINWLDFSHALTFANAGRVQAERHPEIWPDVLLQLACFTGRNAKYANGDQDISRWLVDDPLGYLETASRALMDHGQFEYIVSVHLVKLVTAAREEILARPNAPWAGLMAAAVNRFLNSPLKRKHTTRTARQALSFVAAEG